MSSDNKMEKMMVDPLKSRKLHLKIIKASNLIAVDGGKSSDPYCIIEWGKESVKTNIIYKSLNPQWDAEFSFDESHQEDVPLKISLKDYNTFTRDVNLGGVVIPFKILSSNQEKAIQSFPLEIREGMSNVSGEIFLSFWFQDKEIEERQADPVDDDRMKIVSKQVNNVPSFIEKKVDVVEKIAKNLDVVEKTLSKKDLKEYMKSKQQSIDEDAIPNYLIVTIIKAKDLIAADGSGTNASSDPLVKLNCGKQSEKTRVIKKSLNPIWNQKFTLDILKKPNTLDLIVEDVDLLSNDFLGQVSINLPDWIQMNGKQEIKQWFCLVGKKGEKTKSDGITFGEIEVKIQAMFIDCNLEDFEQGEEDTTEQVDEDVQEFHESEDQRKKREEEKNKMLSELNQVTLQSGDYQIQVHIIEVRDLNAKDLNGSSDPVVFVTCMGQKKHTVVKKNQTSCVFDELFFFNFKDLHREDVESGFVNISVFDADGPAALQMIPGLKNDLIGSFQMDLPHIYYQKHHEYYRQWVALVDESTLGECSIHGYLKLSVAILGPGDKLKVHDLQKEMNEELKLKGTKNVSSLVLMPPRVKQDLNYLVVTIHKVEDLPNMDKTLITQGGIDAYVRVDFAGNAPAKTKVVTMKGSNFLDVEFNQEIWIPVMLPTMANHIAVSVWDWDLTSDEIVANTPGIKFDQVQKHSMLFQTIWINLYGAPLNHALMETKNHALMNRYPQTASTYRGRILCSLRVEKPNSSSSSCSFEKDIIHVKRSPKVKVPETKEYSLRAFIISGTEIPEFMSKSHWGQASKMKIKICIGKYHLETQRKANHKGMVRWVEYLYEDKMKLPADVDQIPDLFVYLVRGSGSSERNVCYMRFNAKEILQKGFEGVKPQWLIFKEDQVLNDLGDGNFPGSLLAQIGFGTFEDCRKASVWNTGIVERLAPYKLFVHVFQGRNLPPADSNGLLDPYIKILCCGQKKKTGKKLKSRDPCFYETLSFDLDLPREEYMPEVAIQVWDWDPWDPDDYAGTVKFPLNQAVFKQVASSGAFASSSSSGAFASSSSGAFASSSSGVSKQGTTTTTTPTTTTTTTGGVGGGGVGGGGGSYPGDVPRPKWYPLFFHELGDSEGELLLSFELIKKTTPDQFISPPTSIQPKMQLKYIEIIALGLRGLKPNGLLPIHMPFTQFSLNDAKTETTNRSKTPSNTDPNFLERIVMPVMLPDDALFAPNLTLTVYDHRLGGFSQPVLGAASIPILSKMPLSCGKKNPYYVPPGGLYRFGNPHLNEIPDDVNFPGVKSRLKADLAAQGNVKKEEEKEEENSQKKSLDLKKKNTVKKTSAARAARGARAGAARGARGASNDDGGGGGGGVENTTTTTTTPTNKNLQLESFYNDDDDPDDDPNNNNKTSLSDTEASEEEEIPDYLLNRDILEMPYEEHHRGSPFESISLFHGQKLGRNPFGINLKSNYRVVGKFKGIIRVISKQSEPPLIDLSLFLNPKHYLVRVYALEGYGFQPMDSNGKSDPYLIASLGKEKVNDRKNYLPATTCPKFHRLFELKAKLPGASELHLEAYDHDLLSGDDFIGATVIDLEDRWFDDAWQTLGTKYMTDTRCAVKPIEHRPLWSATSTASQGTLSLWVEILSTAESVKYQPDVIALPPVEEYELRVVIWKTLQVVPGDELSGLSDMFIKCWLEGQASQETDTHWRCKDGQGSFNWRMKFPVSLPLEKEGGAYLHFQVWDKDLLYNDCLADNLLDLSQLFTKGYKTKNRVNLYAKETTKERKSRRVPTKKKQVAGGGVANYNSSNSSTSSTLLLLSNDFDPDLEGGEYLPLLDDEKKIQLQKQQALSKKIVKNTKNSRKEGAESMIRSLKELIGMGEDPEDSNWITCTTKDNRTGKKLVAGKVLVSIELLPKALAETRSAGLGRSEPNNFPVLPDPTGRLNLSAMWNPFYVFEALVGARAYHACMSFVCCGIVIAALIFGGPLINVLLTASFMFPPPYGWVFLASIVGTSFLFCCYCSWRCKRAIRNDEDVEK